ncbi:MAG: C4-type zinc ribbon domain-containing protein [Candidatus Rokubacteria bacterium]|nr:C4-type zinc ribbon domain-containing protein [Candidatus Rokubacteria bacterium]
MDGQLRTLIDLQAIDTRIAGLEAEVARLPKEIAAIRAALAETRKLVEGARARLDAAKKDTRSKEKDLEVAQAKRTKTEARLWEVKTNREYSAALIEIEEIKQEKSKLEEEILTLMERQDRLVAEIKDTEAKLQMGEVEGAKAEAILREKLAALEVDLAAARSERGEHTRQLPPAVLGDYEKLLRARGGLAMAPIVKPNLCGGCRMTVTPQRLLELRQQTAPIPCESCGRYLYWLP